jgi:hypothetical protein
MSPSEAQSGGSLERPYREQSSQPTPQSDDSELMQQVLEETLAATNGSQPMNPREMQALADVARRHPGQAFSLDPVAIELVSAVLNTQFGEQIADGSERRSMAVRIAETLVESDPARQRLESLWNRLNEAVR